MSRITPYDVALGYKTLPDASARRTICGRLIFFLNKHPRWLMQFIGHDPRFRVQREPDV
jgi:hypothetical protein